MKTIRFILLLCIAVISGTLSAQSQRELGELMRNRGEYYFTLSVNDRSEIQAISGLCSLDGIDGRTVVCYANQKEYDKLLQLGYEPNLQTPPSLREEAKMWDGGDRATYEWDSYLTYGDYVSMMEGFPTSVTNGASCTLLDLGTLSTSNHRKILGVRLYKGNPDGKPKFLYSSTMHGDEVTGMILMLRLINEFCTSGDSRIQNILDNVDLFIFPCTNPDGTYKGGNNTVTGAQRYNGNDVDLNRHFPDFDDGAHPDGASYYQDETQWMMDLAQQYLFTMGANYHGGSEVINYPWDTYQPVHPDDAWWQYVSREYAQLCQAVNSSYMCSNLNGQANPSGITNGYAWYTITGSRQDYMNYYGQCREVTVECSNTKTPNASQLPNFWNYNHNAMLTYIEECLNGVHGVVKDAVTNQPIEGVTVTVLNHDALGSEVSTHAVGDFHRPIKGGSYTFKFSKEGYCNEYVDVTVADGAGVNLPVFLTPGGNCPVVSDCYEQTTQYAAGSYVMGYLNGTTLIMPTHNNGTASTSSVSVTTTDNGFSVVEGTSIPQITLTLYSNGRYYISYNGRYLNRSNNSLTWGTTQSSSGRWYINSDGIYMTSNSKTYYLYYNNGSFALSTSAQNNISFYVQGDCPTPQYTITASVNPSEGGSVTGDGTYKEGRRCILSATANEGYDFVNWTVGGAEVSTEATYSFEVTADMEVVANFVEGTPIVEQIITLKPGWNWWSTYLEGITFGQLMEALDNNVTVTPQNGGSISDILPNTMYIIHSEGAITSSISGPMVDASLVEITLNPGVNWIGYPLNTILPVETALAGVSPAENDVIKHYDGAFATYSGGTWHGTLRTLEPGKGYIYQSNASQAKTFVFPTNR